MEENMVEWLRDVGMPADYINKLARMFQDIKVSNDLNQGFKKEYQNKGDIADSVNIKILNAGAWSRASERIPVSLPTELEDYIPEGGGILQEESQRSQVTVASFNVQWSNNLRQ
ncbi:Cullin-5 [Desmophyllum pertusum]|uniref:Cullin-5 n=1 Tax=Desmophyllum pertusum TaxID=174260 RepID=A0A9X0A762_9CNID|nr:Cullin-5 [Desmophyllum pertusum]